MHLFAGTVDDFLSALSAGRLIGNLQAAFSRLLLSAPSPSEVRSWERSLPALAEVLHRAGIGQAAVLVEYVLPQSSKRADAVIVGRDSEGQAHLVVVELKQWTSADIDDVSGRLVIAGNRLTLHPQSQVAYYVEYLRDFNSALHSGSFGSSGAVYLHNAGAAELRRLTSAAPAEGAPYPVFGVDDGDRLAEFLRRAVGGGDGRELLRRLADAQVRPSRSLLSAVAAEVGGNEQFTLLDDQAVAFELVRRAVADARASRAKQVVIVTGGPGSGKSVVATRLLGRLAADGFAVQHATGSKSFTETMRSHVGRRAGTVFRYFNQFGDVDADGLDVLVCDEAHRIRTTSHNRFTPAAKRTGMPQVDELLQVAKVPVFFLDERQGVRPDEIGSVAGITEAAERLGFPVVQIGLDGQFRSRGSAGYLRWVGRLLGLEEGFEPWKGDDFQVSSARTPAALESWINRRDGHGGTARMAAGFCWPWSDPTPDGRLVPDVEIGSWARPWNAKPGKKVADAPPASLWASDPRGLGQVGCIYTAQGFEYDFNGVIMGPDLVRRGDRWVAQPSASADSVVRRAANFDQLVRHAYRVLLTRGMHACSVHSTDAETQSFLEEVLPE